MDIHAIQTGTVAIKRRQREGRGRGQGRLVNTLLDREWTEPLPIYAYLIDHPEGAILVDTGDTSRVHEPGYFPRWHPYYRFGVRFDVKPEDEVGPRLEALGIHPDEVDQVVLTHLHTDHAGGIHHFPRSRVRVSAREWSKAQGVPGMLRGYLPHRWPEWLRPETASFAGEPFGPFPASVPITDSGDVRLVPTHGHTPGHVSVVLDEGDHLVFFAGDSSYAQRYMLDGTIDGVTADTAASARALERTRLLARERDVVYLPAHDPDAERRLTLREPVFPRAAVEVAA